MVAFALLSLWATVLGSFGAAAQTGAAGSLRAESTVSIDRAALPPAASAIISRVNLRSADLRDVFQAIATESGLNVVVDDAVVQRATVSLEGITALDAVLFLVREYGLSLEQRGAVFRVGPAPPLPPPPFRLEVRDGRLTIDAQDVPLLSLVRRLAEEGGPSIIPRDGVAGNVTAFLQDVPLLSGLQTLLDGNGFALRERNGVYTVEYGAQAVAAPSSADRQGVYVYADSLGRFELDLRNAEVGTVLREIGRQSAVGVVVRSAPQGRVTLAASGLTLDAALRAVLSGTGASYRRQGTSYVVGVTPQDGVLATSLLRLGYISVEGVLELIPPSLSEGITVQKMQSQNALLVTGPNDRIAAIEAFLAEIDSPPPQVLIEALVVDFLDTDASALGVTFGRGLIGTDSSGTALPSGYVLDGLNTGGLDVTLPSRDASNVINSGLGVLGLGSIGRLPPDFYLRIRALEQEGRVEVRSRPQVATLNGTPASLSIGTTQYYILRATTPIGIGNGNNVVTQQTERFEKIEANVSLRVTPYVGPSGEVTALIIPEFSQPIGELQNGIPPTISTRRIESTVRLRDGETIILGGLIEDRDVYSDNKIPILGDLPLIGRFFRSRVRSRRRSELVIYLTPHVFYGGEDEPARWRRLFRDRTSPDGPAPDSTGPIRTWGQDQAPAPPSRYDESRRSAPPDASVPESLPPESAPP